MRRWWLSGAALSLIAATGEPDPVRAIVALAEDLIDQAQMYEPPADLRVLASLRDILDIRAAEMEAAGRLVPERGHLAIEVNREHTPGKRNFTVCHEINHTLIPTYYGGLIEDADTGRFADDSEEELLCDIGGSALLLRSSWLREVALQTGPAIGTLCYAAEFFGALLQATARKLAELDMWPCAFVLWEEGYRKSERIPEAQHILPELLGFGLPAPKWRVRHVYHSPSFGHFVPLNKSAPDGSVVAACCDESGPLRATERFELGHRPVEMRCESVYAPYRLGGAMRPRVISILLPVRASLAPAVSVSNLRLDLL